MVVEFESAVELE